jgi:tripartite-type tricarboxylate transporter receptor subunit TctC
VTALLGGEVALVMATVPPSIQDVQSGRLVALGVAAAQRSQYLPGIPTISETIKGVEGAVNAGVLAPVGTPPGVVERLNAEFARASATPRVKEIFAVNAAESQPMTPAQLQASLERDVKAWAEVVKATGVKLQ